MKVVQNVIRMPICDCQYVIMLELECNFSALIGINIKVVQNVIMMSEHFSQKSCSECLHENFYIQCFSSSNDLLTFHRLITFMNMFCSASSVTKLLLTSHIRQFYFKEKNLIHAETGIIDTDILLLVPHFYKQKKLRQFVFRNY